MATWQKFEDEWVLTDPRSQGEVLLSQVPDHLLRPSRKPGKQGSHQAQLIRWFEKRGTLPTLAELDAERRRRGYPSGS